MPKKAEQPTKAAPAKKTEPAKATAAKKTAAATTKAAPATPKEAAKAVKAPVTAKKAAPKKATAPAKAAKTPITDKWLLKQQALLQQERATYSEQADALKAEADQMAQEMEPGDIQFDEESGEGGTMAVDRERDLVLSAQARAAVDDIDLALHKVEMGTYGICESCGQPIPKQRLEALPYARLCVACKSGGLSRR